MRISRSEFVQSLEGKKVSLDEMSDDRGISSDAKAKMARADLNRDGYITGAEETDQLFNQMDHYDSDGNANTVTTTNNLDVRAVHATLMRSAVDEASAPSTPSAPQEPQSRLGELLANNPEVRDNQDLLNHFLRRNRNNWSAAGADANRHGVDLNDLVSNRDAPIRDGGVSTQPTTPTRPTTNNTSVAGIGNVAGKENTSRAFQQKVVEVAERLQMDPTNLMAVMSFETGESFSSSVRNRHTGATGLIQFMPSTARRLGTTTSQLAQMSPERQLDYVEEYLSPYRGRMDTVEDAYMAVLWPAAVGDGPNRVLFRRGTRAYRQNNGLDINNNGYITAREAANKVRAKIQ